MIRGLARHLENNAQTPSQPQTEYECRESSCRVVETRVPLDELVGDIDIQAKTLALLGAGDNANIRDALFVDTETTGLTGGSVAFLIGMGFVEGDNFVVRQLLMRDYDEEQSSLSVFLDSLEDAAFLVSYNGKSFDMPLLRTRAILNSLRSRLPNPEPCHVDLLHASRRIWKKRLVSCTQKRIEEEILGRIRPDDLPGAEVPRRYFEYLKLKDERLLLDILRHNADDIKGMAGILVRLASIYTDPLLIEDELDKQSLVLSLEKRAAVLEHRQNDPAAALECVERAMLAATNDDMRRLERRRARLVKKLCLIQN